MDAPVSIAIGSIQSLTFCPILLIFKPLQIEIGTTAPDRCATLSGKMVVVGPISI